MHILLKPTYHKAWRISTLRTSLYYMKCIRPCIVIYIYSKTNQMHQCIKLFYFGMTLYMFRTVFPFIIRRSRLYIQQQAYVRFCCLLTSKQTVISVWQMPVAVCTVLNSWWWMERPSETCTVSFQNKTIWYVDASGWFYYRNIESVCANWSKLLQGLS